MSRIERLTDAQAARLIEFRQEYFKHGTSCEPADRKTAETAISEAYKTINRKPPHFIWADSPLAASIIFHLLGSDEMRSSLGSSLGSSLESSLRSSLVGSSLRSSLESSLGSSLRTSLWSSDIVPQTSYWWGAQDLYWVAFYQYCAEIGVAYEDTASRHLDIMDRIGKSCMWWYPRDGICVVSERPSEIHWAPTLTATDLPNRLHNPNGPAVRFRDGWSTYAWEGVLVEPWLIERPEAITIDKIATEHNAEIRRVMIERFGMERYLEDSGAALIQEDRFGQLYKRDFGDDTMAMVKVINSSPEPDGSFNRYVLSVPPEMETAHEAVAWTFGKTVATYNPVLET